MVHDNIAFQKRFPLSLSPCTSLFFSFFVEAVPVMGGYLKQSSRSTLFKCFADIDVGSEDPDEII
jgi:hypothetical protein